MKEAAGLTSTASHVNRLKKRGSEEHSPPGCRVLRLNQLKQSFSLILLFDSFWDVWTQGKIRIYYFCEVTLTVICIRITKCTPLLFSVLITKLNVTFSKKKATREKEIFSQRFLFVQTHDSFLSARIPSGDDLLLRQNDLKLYPTVFLAPSLRSATNTLLRTFDVNSLPFAFYACFCYFYARRKRRPHTPTLHTGRAVCPQGAWKSQTLPRSADQGAAWRGITRVGRRVEKCVQSAPADTSERWKSSRRG